MWISAVKEVSFLIMINREEKKSILKILNEQYNLQCDNDQSLVSVIENYSYIYRVKFKSTGYIVKKLPYSEQRFKSLNTVFHKLEMLDFVEKPVKTINAMYLAHCEKYLYIVFHMIDEIDTSPSSEWWGWVVSQIQKVDKSDIQGICIDSKWLETGTSLFSSAIDYLDKSIYGKLEFMYQDALANLKGIDNDPPFFLHGDLSEGNVLIDDSEYRIIDFDRFGVGPKEYDLQRLIWMKMEHEKSFENLEIFVKELILSYERCTKEVVDRKVLWHLMEMDFVQAFCWLSIVVRDFERGDREGNLVMLSHYTEIIKNDGFDSIRKILTMSENDVYNLQ